MIKTSVTIRKTKMIEPEQMQHRRLEIFHTHGIARNLVAEFVGLAVLDSTLHATACHPHGEGVRMMIAAEECFVAIAILRNWCATKLAAPDDERVFKEAASAQIANERRDGGDPFRGIF